MGLGPRWQHGSTQVCGTRIWAAAHGAGIWVACGWVLCVVKQHAGAWGRNFVEGRTCVCVCVCVCTPPVLQSEGHAGHDLMAKKQVYGMS